MKNGILLIGFLLGISCNSFTNNKEVAQDSAKGIQFYHSIAEGLAKAKETGKPLFVDAYAVWCGPCKWMSSKIFTQESVGNYYNEHFINVKLDAEKGEGIEFSNKYKIQAYPTLFFLSSEGKVLQKTEGALDGPQLLSLGSKVLNRYEGK